MFVFVLFEGFVGGWSVCVCLKVGWACVCFKLVWVVGSCMCVFGLCGWLVVLCWCCAGVSGWPVCVWSQLGLARFCFKLVFVLGLLSLLFFLRAPVFYLWCCSSS